MHRKFILISNVFICFVLVGASTSSVNASRSMQQSENELTITYTFNEPQFTDVIINGFSCTKIEITNLSTIADLGDPALPCKGAYILLPPKSCVKQITIFSRQQIYLGANFRLCPIKEQQPISQASIPQQLQKKSCNTTTKDLFPHQLYSQVGIYEFRGYSILILDIFPVQYCNGTGELYFNPEITLTIKMMEDNTKNLLYRGLKKDKDSIQEKIDNPTMINAYNQLKPYSDLRSVYDLLILTPDELKSSFIPLQEAHKVNGIKTQITTLEEINSYNPDDIKKYIRNEYNTSAITYVLLGGDHDCIPAKYLWAEQYNVPSDLYYCCLDGPFNYDEDEFWGEPTDGKNGGDVDLMAELYIGRAPADTTEEVNNFVFKTLNYLNCNASKPYLKNILLAGEFLGLPPLELADQVQDRGGTYMDELVNESEANGFYTKGIPYEDNHIMKLYDRHDIWPKETMFDFLNNDTHIVNHLGHAWYDMNLKLKIDDVCSLTNNDYFFVYSQGCMSGGFDNPEGYDCIAEYFTVKTNHGAFAGIWNARNGWYQEYGTDGSSQRYHRQFWDAVYGEKITTLSKANQDSKEDNLFAISKTYMRICYYELNFFGDPTLGLYVFDSRNKAPETPMRPSGETSGKINVEYTFTTSSTDPEADQVIYMWDWGDGNYSDWLGPYISGEKANATYSWKDQGAYQIRVKAKDVHGDESNWSKPLGISIPKNNALPLSFFQRSIIQFYQKFLLAKISFSQII